MNVFEPFLSYRQPGGTVQQPTGALTRHSSVFLLIHGYNTDQGAASGSYRRFARFQTELGPVSAHLMGVYWPGDNWTGPLNYMSAIGKAGATARRLAADVHAAARARGFLRVDVVAHSLGCRLTLEMLQELERLQRQNRAPGLVLGRIVLMAGAVPVHYLAAATPQPPGVRRALESVQGAKSLYSGSDAVLRFAFPLGQTVAGEGTFPTALGRKSWPGASGVVPRMHEEENVTAGHGDYWSGDSNPRALRQAARAVRSFTEMGTPPARVIPDRPLPTLIPEPGRETTAARSIAGRTTPERKAA